MSATLLFGIPLPSPRLRPWSSIRLHALVLLGAASITQGDWQFSAISTEGDTGNHAVLALDHDDNPHIAHFSRERKQVRYARWDGVRWHEKEVTEFGGFNDRTGSYPNYYPNLAIEVDQDRVAHIMFALGKLPPFHGEPDRIRYVTALPDGQVSPVEVLPPSFVFTNTFNGFDFALSPRGEPHLLVASYAEGKKLLHLWRPAGAEEWRQEDFVQAGYVDATFGFDQARLSFGPDGIPHFCAANYQIAVVGKYDPAQETWTWQAGPDSYRFLFNKLDPNPPLPDLRIGTDNEPRMAYFAKGDGSAPAGSPDRSLYFARRVANAWQVEEVAAGIEVRWLSMTLDTNDAPHVIYYVPGDNEDEWRHASRTDEGQWSTETILRDQRVILGELPSRERHLAPTLDVEMNSEGRLQLAFDTGPPFGNLMFGEFRPTYWRFFSLPGGDNLADTAPSLDVDNQGAPHVAYTYKPDRASAANELRYAFRDSATQSWQTETVLVSPEGLRGFQATLDTLRQERALTSYSLDARSIEYSWRDEGTWRTGSIQYPPYINDLGPDIDRRSHLELWYDGYGGVDEAFAIYADTADGIRFAKWGDPDWWIRSHSPLESGRQYVFWSAVRRSWNRVYVLYGQYYHDLRLAIWDGNVNLWVHDETLPTSELPGNPIKAAVLDWDEASDRPVAVFTKQVSAMSSPIYIAHRADGESLPRTWTINHVADPGFPFKSLQAEFLVAKQVLAFSSYLRPVHLLVRETGSPDWIPAGPAGELGGGEGLSMEAFPDRVWLAYPYINYTHPNPSGLRVAFRSLESPIIALTGTVEYVTGYVGSRISNDPEVPDFNPMKPCPEEQEKRQSGATAAMTAAPQGDLDVLRAVRDRFRATGEGRRMIDLYYAHSEETGRLALENPTLLLQAFQLIRNLIPGLADVAKGNPEVELDASSAGLLDAILDQLTDLGSPELKTAIEAERSHVGPLDNLVGRTYLEAAVQLGVVSPQPAIQGAIHRQGKFEIKGTVPENFEAYLLRSHSITPAQWQRVEPVESVPGTNGTVLLIDPSPPNSNTFYRLRATPVP